MRRVLSLVLLTGVTSLYCLLVSVGTAVACWMSKFVALAAFMLEFAVGPLISVLVVVNTHVDLSVLNNTGLVVIHVGCHKTLRPKLIINTISEHGWIGLLLDLELPCHSYKCLEGKLTNAIINVCCVLYHWQALVSPFKCYYFYENSKSFIPCIKAIYFSMRLSHLKAKFNIVSDISGKFK